MGTREVKKTTQPRDARAEVRTRVFLNPSLWCLPNASSLKGDPSVHPELESDYHPKARLKSLPLPTTLCGRQGGCHAFPFYRWRSRCEGTECYVTGYGDRAIFTTPVIRHLGVSQNARFPVILIRVYWDPLFQLSENSHVQRRFYHIP